MNNNGHKLLRVCHLISSFRPVIGGSERATEQLCAALVRDGVDTIILTRWQSRNTSRFEVIKNVPVYRLGYPAQNRLGPLTYALHTLWLLTIRFRSYDVLHAQSPDTPLLLGIFAKFILGRRLILTIHGGNRIRDYLRSRLGRLRLFLIGHFVDQYTAITPEIQEQLQALGVPLSRITPVPNGIDIRIYSPPDASQRAKARRDLNLPETGRVVMFLGRLDPVKRVDLLLQAWAFLPRHEHDQLLIVGSGSDMVRLKKLTHRLKITVRFEGPADDSVRYLHAADILVLPTGIRSSSSYEGLSVALMEAMAAGLAVVATNCPGNRVLIRNGHNGLLFPVEDVDGLTRQLNRLLEDPALRAHLGRNAHTSVVNDYAIDVVARKTKLLYSQINNFVAAS